MFDNPWEASLSLPGCSNTDSTCGIPQALALDECEKVGYQAHIINSKSVTKDLLREGQRVPTPELIELDERSCLLSIPNMPFTVTWSRLAVGAAQVRFLRRQPESSILLHSPLSYSCSSLYRHEAVLDARR